MSAPVIVLLWIEIVGGRTWFGCHSIVSRMGGWHNSEVLWQVGLEAVENPVIVADFNYLPMDCCCYCNGVWNWNSLSALRLLLQVIPCGILKTRSESWLNHEQDIKRGGRGVEACFISFWELFCSGDGDKRSALKSGNKENNRIVFVGNR